MRAKRKIEINILVCDVCNEVYQGDVQPEEFTRTEVNARVDGWIVGGSANAPNHYCSQECIQNA